MREWMMLIDEMLDEEMKKEAVLCDTDLRAVAKSTHCLFWPNEPSSRSKLKGPCSRHASGAAAGIASSGAKHRGTGFRP